MAVGVEEEVGVVPAPEAVEAVAEQEAGQVFVAAEVSAVLDRSWGPAVVRQFVAEGQFALHPAAGWTFARGVAREGPEGVERKVGANSRDRARQSIGPRFPARPIASGLPTAWVVPVAGI